MQCARHARIRQERKHCQTQNTLLAAELRLAEAQLADERAARNEEVAALSRALQLEQSRWKCAAAEGWATASRESKRCHATQLACMSSTFSAFLS